jgi:hypothetical protein
MLTVTIADARGACCLPVTPTGRGAYGALQREPPVGLRVIAPVPNGVPVVIAC